MSLQLATVEMTMPNFQYVLMYDRFITIYIVNSCRLRFNKIWHNVIYKTSFKSLIIYKNSNSTRSQLTYRLLAREEKRNKMKVKTIEKNKYISICIKIPSTLMVKEEANMFTVQHALTFNIYNICFILWIRVYIGRFDSLSWVESHSY